MAEQTATDEALASLRTQMDKTKTEAQQVVEEATTAVAEANKKANDANAARVQADKTAIQNGIAAAEAAADAAEMRLAEASEKGDHVAVAKATREMNEAITTKNTYQNRKANLEAWERRQQQAPLRPPPQSQPQLQQQGRQFTAATQAWLDKQGIDGQTDNPKFLKAQGAHFKAVAEGLRADTPEYFEFINRDFGVTETATAESPLSQAADTVVVDLSKPATQQQQEQRRDPPPVALAPTRPAPTIAPSSNQIVNGKVSLSAGEVEAARFSNPELYKKDPDAAILQYAQNKAKLIQEGRL